MGIMMQLELPLSCFKYRVGDMVLVDWGDSDGIQTAMIEERWWVDPRSFSEVRDDGGRTKRTDARYHIIIETVEPGYGPRKYRYACREDQIVGLAKPSWSI